MDQKEARTVSEDFLKEKPITDLYDEVIIPALAMAEQDRHQGLLKPNNEAFIVQSINELIVELVNYAPEPQSDDETCARPPNARIEKRFNSRVICVPADDKADEITAAMLAQVLEQSGCRAISLLATDLPLAVREEISNHPGDIVCICALPPFAVLHARTLSKHLRSRFPELKMVVGIWNFSEDGPKVQERLWKDFDTRVVTTLTQALEEIYNLTTLDSHAPQSVSMPSLEVSKTRREGM